MSLFDLRVFIFPISIGAVVSCFGCSESDYDRYGLGNDYSDTQTSSVGDTAPIEDAQAADSALDASPSDDTDADTRDSALSAGDETGAQDSDEGLDTADAINADPQDGENTENGSDPEDRDSGCPLNSGYPCACNTAICDDKSDCLAHGDSLTGFCSRSCEGNRDRGACDTSLYGISEPPSGACAVAAQPESRGADHCAVVCRQGDLSGECPPELVCTPADGVEDLGYCLPPQPNGGE